jgi:aquaporin Z
VSNQILSAEARIATNDLARQSALVARHGALRHLPEYLIEAFLLGMFMISAGLVTTAFDYPGSPLHALIPGSDARRVLTGIAMGLTAIALIYSPWGKRSGAHMNPAVTLTFLRLGHIERRDAAFYILAQLVGGTLGVFIVLAVLGHSFADPPINYVVTLPGQHGSRVALIAELTISFLMMTMILRASNSARHMKYTGLYAGLLVAAYIGVEGPLSGMSMNPARSFASALPAGQWTAFWIYLIAPVTGMQVAAAMHLFLLGRQSVKCAKLLHTRDQRCIFCGFEPKPSSSS